MSTLDKTEEAILRAGMTAPRITPDVIAAAMEKVEYVSSQPEGTTSTFVHAYLKSSVSDRKFLLATGQSACVSPQNFNAQIGLDIAQRQAVALATSKMWELLGFTLFQEMEHAGQ